jgi:hypothetical protein
MSGQDTYTFRRSRTLTGSVSSSVKAATELQAQLESPRLKAHELRQHRRSVLAGLLGCVLLASFFYWLLTQFVAQITTIAYAPKGGRVPDQTVYKETVQSYFRTRPFERFHFALNEGALQEYVQSKLPEVSAISLSNEGIGEGTLLATVREPVVGWKVGSSQYYVDAEGVSFRKNYFKPPQVTVRDKSGITPDANGGAIASNRFLSFLGRVVTLTKQMGVGEVTTVTIPSGVGTRTVEINLKGRSFPVRMHIDRDSAAQVQDTQRALRFFDKRGIKPKYIDVRVAGKAFYQD